MTQYTYAQVCLHLTEILPDNLLISSKMSKIDYYQIIFDIADEAIKKLKFNEDSEDLLETLNEWVNKNHISILETSKCML